jgi:hypothetical protein
MPWMPQMNRCPAVSESKTKLKDIYDPDSGQSVRKRVLDSTGQVLPLVYIYDMGVRFLIFHSPLALLRTFTLKDYWEHELIFKGTKIARAARPLFSAATGIM